MSFDVVLCKYGLLLEKPTSMSLREIIRAMILESLLEPDPYNDVDDVVGHEPNEIMPCGVKKKLSSTLRNQTHQITKTLKPSKLNQNENLQQYTCSSKFITQQSKLIWKPNSKNPVVSISQYKPNLYETKKPNPYETETKTKTEDLRLNWSTHPPPSSASSVHSFTINKN